MRRTRRKQLAECNSSKPTRRNQLVEFKGRKTGRKLTRLMIIIIIIRQVNFRPVFRALISTNCFSRVVFDELHSAS